MSISISFPSHVIRRVSSIFSLGLWLFSLLVCVCVMLLLFFLSLSLSLVLAVFRLNILLTHPFPPSSKHVFAKPVFPGTEIDYIPAPAPGKMYAFFMFSLMKRPAFPVPYFGMRALSLSYSLSTLLLRRTFSVDWFCRFTKLTNICHERRTGGSTTNKCTGASMYTLTFCKIERSRRPFLSPYRCHAVEAPECQSITIKLRNKAAGQQPHLRFV